MKSKQRLIAETLYRHQSNAGRILDVGYAQNPNPALRGEVFGIDIVADQKPENYAEVKKVDLNECRIPYPDKHFDAIGMGCVLAHVVNPLGLLIELHRVLKDDGIIVLSSPNPNYYWENVLNVFFHQFKHRVSKAKWIEHFYSFSRWNMRTIADRAGFGIIEEVGVSFRVVKLGWAFQPVRYPGIAYEIIYVLKKNGEPQRYTTYEGPKGVEKIPTTFSRP